jgi:hypothetical protein
VRTRLREIDGSLFRSGDDQLLIQLHADTLRRERKSPSYSQEKGLIESLTTEGRIDYHPLGVDRNMTFAFYSPHVKRNLSVIQNVHKCMSE